MIAAAEFIRSARTWVGVPFRHQGRSREGVDCIGLIMMVGVENGCWTLEQDVNDYGSMPNEDTLPRVVATKCEEIPAPIAGCMVLMRLVRNTQHAGIFTGNSIIHAWEGVGMKRVVEAPWRHPWPPRFVSAWKLPGVIYE